jgi:hypothetical protein
MHLKLVQDNSVKDISYNTEITSVRLYVHTSITYKPWA